MDEDLLVSEINQILKSKWSKKQTAIGKWIEVQWSWTGLIGKTVNKYKECGWIVKKQVELGPEGRRVWLIFMNPNWIRKDRKIRDHLPY
jgi:hypothetical protein